MLADVLLHHVPDLNSDHKNIIVSPTEVFHGTKKSAVDVSVYLGNTDATFLGVSSGVLSLVCQEKVDYSKLFTNAGQTTVSTECLPHLFYVVRTLLQFLMNEKHNHTFQNHNTTIDHCVEASSYFGFTRCTTTPLMRTVTSTSSCARWTITTSSNRTTSTRSGCTSRSPFVLSRRSTCATGLSLLLHNKPNTDELTGNLAPAEMDLIHFSRSS